MYDRYLYSIVHPPVPTSPCTFHRLGGIITNISFCSCSMLVWERRLLPPPSTLYRISSVRSRLASRVSWRSPPCWRLSWCPSRRIIFISFFQIKPLSSTPSALPSASRIAFRAAAVTTPHRSVAIRVSGGYFQSSQSFRHLPCTKPNNSLFDQSTNDDCCCCARRFASAADVVVGDTEMVACIA